MNNNPDNPNSTTTESITNTTGFDPNQSSQTEIDHSANVVQQPQNTIPQQTEQATVDNQDSSLHVYPSNNVSEPENESAKKSKKGMIFLLLFLIFTILFGGLTYTTYALAYEKIKLEKYPDIQYAISNFVMSLPFTPKTPKFLLAKAFEAEKDLTSSRFDLSSSIKLSQTEGLFGMNQFDFQLKGEKNKKSEIDYDVSFNLSLGKEFNSDFIKHDTLVYFKINTIPKTMLNTIGMKSDLLDPMLNLWISYDTKSLETNSSKELKEKELQESKFTDEYIKETLNNVIDEKITENIKVSSIKENGDNLYELYLSADNDLVNYLQSKILKEIKTQNSDYVVGNKYNNDTKVSDYLKNLVVKIHIDKNEYYIKKIIVSFDIISDKNISSIINDSNVLGLDTSVYSFLQSKISVALVAAFDGQGESVDVQSPPVSITLEEASRRFQEILPQLYSTPDTTNNGFSESDTAIE